MTDVHPPKGSQWRPWDLHVHTPASLVHRYKGDNVWQAFFDDLRGLPTGYVLGINDYLFVDGYERVQHEHESGGLPNIAAVFPVVEFRLDNLAGTHGHLNRINAHVIFSNDISPATIMGQFTNGLSTKYVLDPATGVNTEWEGLPTLEGLTEFGRRIRASTPDSIRHTLARSDLKLGFNNLVLPFAAIQDQLQLSAFRDRSILAVGKTEWQSIQWNSKSIAIKKHIVNSSSLIFTAAPDLATYHKGREQLKKAGLKDHLIDCSDAHTFSSSTDKDRIGNNMTWINADPTFEGLLHAITEFDDRVFVGELPSKLEETRSRPHDHISEVSIRRKPSQQDTEHKYFDINVPINPGFVAIVGNKGQGKSALLDSIGLASGSRNEPHFTFLSKQRFRNPRHNSAESYEVTVQWENGENSTCGLDESVSEDLPERVTYLPQHLIDTICTADPGEEPVERFNAELGKVLFAHVREADRLGARDLGSLIQMRTNELDRRITLMRGELSAINRRIATEEAKLLPERRRELEGQLRLARRQLADHEALRPPDPVKPPAVSESAELREISSTMGSLKETRNRTEVARKDVQQCLTQVAALSATLAQLSDALETLQRNMVGFVETNRPRAKALGLELDKIVSLEIDLSTIEAKSIQLKEERSTAEKMLDVEVEGSIPFQIVKLDERIATAKAQLEGPSKEYTKQVDRLQAWSETRHSLAVGTADRPGEEILESRIAELDKLPGYVANLRSQRLNKVREIHAALLQSVSVYTDLYRPALNFIQQHRLATLAQLEFGVELQQRDLGAVFWDIFARNVVSSFQGRVPGTKLLDKLIGSTDFNTEDTVVGFVTKVDEALHFDIRGPARKPIDPFRAIRKGHTLEKLYDLIFGLEYLRPVYSLKYSGVPIDRLSPGEKGSLLLMFYLLVDRSVTPLLLDQPDENLDNQTVKELLVPAIKEARQRRQIIVITHNPNVAVVADADQVIVARMDDKTFSYECGAIESTRINRQVVDILEGTWPAFVNRSDKYHES